MLHIVQPRAHSLRGDEQRDERGFIGHLLVVLNEIAMLAVMMNVQQCLIKQEEEPMMEKTPAATRVHVLPTHPELTSFTRQPIPTAHIYLVEYYFR